MSDMKQRNAEHDSERREVVERLFQVWCAFPDLRLCQLIVNATNKNDPFYVSDEVLFVKLDEFAKKHGK